MTPERRWGTPTDAFVATDAHQLLSSATRVDLWFAATFVGVGVGIFEMLGPENDGLDVEM